MEAAAEEQPVEGEPAGTHDAGSAAITPLAAAWVANPKAAPATQEEESTAEAGELPAGEVMASLSQCTAKALDCRKMGQANGAVKQLKMALHMCEGRERDHPALAVEAARARLNLGGALSRAGRHAEAMDAIKDAQSVLIDILVWAEDCGQGDSGVEKVVGEARMLRCAALMAQGIELEPYAGRVRTPEATETERSPFLAQADGFRGPTAHEALYAEAQEFAEDLSAAHPVAKLARILHAESLTTAEAAASFEDASALQVGSLGFDEQASRTLPPVRESSSATLGRSLRLSPTAKLDASFRSSHGKALTSPPPPPHGQSVPPTPSAAGVTSEHGGLDRSTSSRLRAATEPPGGGRKQPATKGERVDIFTEFVRAREEEKANRLGDKKEREEEYKRHRLGQVHRSTQLLLELSDDDELKSKRYTRTGHKVFMEKIIHENRCRSDPSLVTEAKRVGDSPEILQVKKLFRELDVKPRTPPPKVEKPRPLDFLKESATPAFQSSSKKNRVPKKFKPSLTRSSIGSVLD